MKKLYKVNVVSTFYVFAENEDDASGEVEGADLASAASSKKVIVEWCKETSHAFPSTTDPIYNSQNADLEDAIQVLELGLPVEVADGEWDFPELTLWIDELIVKLHPAAVDENREEFFGILNDKKCLGEVHVNALEPMFNRLLQGVPDLYGNATTIKQFFELLMEWYRDQGGPSEFSIELDPIETILSTVVEDEEVYNELIEILG